MLTKKRRIALMFILFNLIYISVTMLFIRSGDQLPGIINFTWVMIGGIGETWFIDVLQANSK